MAHRPYPNVDRALNQISRHYPDPPATPLPPALQSLHNGFQQMRESAQRAGAYVLSTRRPAVSPHVASRFPAEFINKINQPRRPGVVSGGA